MWKGLISFLSIVHHLPLSLSQTLPPPSGKGGRKLPPTPSEAPYQPHPPPHDSAHHHSHHGRPHSRAESEPNPLPLPWRPSLVQKYSSHERNEGAPHHMKPLHTSPPPQQSFTEGGGGSHGNPTQLISPLTQMGGASSSSSSKKMKRSKPSYGERLLRPVRPIPASGGLNKRISTSVDMNLDVRGGGGRGVSQDLPAPLVTGRIHSGVGGGGGGGGGQVGPHHHDDHTHPPPQVGWAHNYRVGSLPRRSRDIQALMQQQQPFTSPYNSFQDISVIGGLDGGRGGGGGKGSITSVDIKTELFSGGYGGKGGEAWGHDGVGVSPYGSRVGSGYGNRRVSPHGSTGTSPYGSTTVSPHGSRAVSPRHSTVISPLPDPGSRVISPSHSRVIGRPFDNDGGGGGEVPKSKRRHHRSISANPATKLQNSDYYAHEVNGLHYPNGAHHYMDHHQAFTKPPHHLLPVTDDAVERKKLSAGKSRTLTHSHTHPGGRGQPGDRQSYTEL